MKKNALQFAIGLFIISNSAFAQQWNGSTTASGDISRDGNVGIGTSAFPVKLSLFSSQLNDGIYLSGNNSNFGLLTNTTQGSWNSLTQAGDHLLFWQSAAPDDVNAGGLVIGPWSNGYKGMRIASTGNVGIGTVTPNEKLEVAGNLRLANGNTDGSRLVWLGGTNGTQEYRARIAPQGFLAFFPGEGNPTTLTLTQDGNVGIGTTYPGSFKLAVEGNIAARGIKVTLQNPFPDYVFDSTYQLRPLTKLEQYINQNKHLPGIPSAKEVEKDGGVELGAMNVKLLEKVEELTLYMIELKKENEEMKKEIKELKEKK